MINEIKIRIGQDNNWARVYTYAGEALWLETSYGGLKYKIGDCDEEVFTSYEFLENAKSMIELQALANVEVFVPSFQVANENAIGRVIEFVTKFTQIQYHDVPSIVDKEYDKYDMEAYANAKIENAEFSLHDYVLRQEHETAQLQNGGSNG